MTRPALLFAAAFLLAASARALSVTGKVVGVLSADTVVVSVNGATETVRLWGVTAARPFSSAADVARQYLVNETLGHVVLMDLTPADKVPLGVLRLTDGRNVNHALIREGLAFWNQSDAPDDREFAELERLAKADRRGVWKTAEPPAAAKSPAEPWLSAVKTRARQSGIPRGGETVPESIIDRATTDASRRADVPIGNVRVVEAAAVDWADGSYGCPEPEKIYTQAQVPGYKVTVKTPSRVYDYHAARGGLLFLCETAPSEAR